MAGKPTSKRDIDHRALSIERGEIPFDGDDPKHTGIHADTSKLTDEEVQSNPLYWRERIKRARGAAFDDAKKTEWLAAFEKTGKVILACDEVGVDRQIEERAMDGYENDVFDKDGVAVGIKRTYETALAVKMLGRYDRDYKDRSEVDITSGGKVIAAPPRVGSLEEFERDVASRLREGHAAVLRQREEDEAADAQEHHNV